MIKCQCCLSPKHLIILCPQMHKSNVTKINNSLTNKSDCMSLLMQILMVKLLNKGKFTMIRLLFDDGSQQSLRKEY